jgi:hypothetical protein
MPGGVRVAKNNRSFMIGICQGKTELSSIVFVKDKRSCPRPSSRRGLLASRFLTGRAQYASNRERILYLHSSFFRPRVFASR